MVARKTGPDKATEPDVRLCTIEGCNRKLRARGYCATHWARWRRNGAPVLQEKTTYECCQAEGCRNPTRSAHSEWCEKHYGRLRRRGSLDVDLIRIPDAKCVTEWCARKAERTDGLCRACNARVRARGTVDYVGYRTPDDEATYDTIHQRLRQRYGSASNYPCVDCGGVARHWAYNHDDEDAKCGLAAGTPYVLRFSVKLEHYSPRCVPCHKRFDLGRICSENGGI